MELFAEIRREYQFGIGTIKGVARTLGVHRRVVRQALADAVPPAFTGLQRDLEQNFKAVLQSALGLSGNVEGELKTL